MKSLLSAIEFDKGKTKSYITLLSSPLLLTLYWYHGSAKTLGRYFPHLKSDPLFDVYSSVWQGAVFFLLMLVVPALFIRWYWKRPFTDFGCARGDYAYGIKFMIVVIPLIVVPLTFVASQMADIRQEYPLARVLLSRRDMIVWYELAHVTLYYTAWEFYFRGFLLFGLRDYFGSANAILIQTIPSCLIHLGKPEPEIIGSIVAGLILGALAIRTRSFWYGMVIHAAIGVLTDLFVLF